MICIHSNPPVTDMYINKIKTSIKSSMIFVDWIMIAKNCFLELIVHIYFFFFFFSIQETVPLLVDLTVEGEMKESALLSTLRALTNLSTTERHHGQYTRMVQHLYNLMDAGSTPVKLQALKVLVNLSCSADMVQHLLAAKVCSKCFWILLWMKIWWGLM